MARALQFVASGFVAIGVAVAAAFYALIPGYKVLYLSALALALVGGVAAHRKKDDPDLRIPAGAIISASVIYWTLAGAALPEWANGIFLIVVPVINATAVIQLRNRQRRSSVR